MARIIAISNRKGGTGKTTTAVNLASGLAIFHNKKVLLIDTDPQGSSTIHLGFLPNTSPSILEILTNKIKPQEVITETNIERLFLIPSNSKISKLEPMMFYNTKGEYLLKEQIDKISENFNFIIIDPPPAIGMIGLNVLIASTEIIIPLRKDFLSMEGTNAFFTILSKIIEKKNKNLKIDGILFTHTEENSLRTPNNFYTYCTKIKIVDI